LLFLLLIVNRTLNFLIIMVKYLKIIILWVLLLGSSQTFAQIDTVFWFAMPHLTHSHPGRPVKLCVSTFGQAATVTVTKPATNTTITTFTVPANSSNAYELISSSESALTGFECLQNQTSNYGICIRSTAKINAYIAVQNNNSEIYSLKGKNAYGTQFMIPMQNQYVNANAYNDARNSVEVIATEPGTTITITPTVTLWPGTHAANVPFTVNLNKGQVYSFASNSQTAANHLCGTTISSNKPVVVDISDDSVTPNGGNQDLVAEQIVPEALAGRYHIAVPSPSAANNNYNGSLCDYLFFHVLHDGTSISINGANVYANADRGEIIARQFENHNAIYIEATQPIFVFQVTGAGKELGGTLLPNLECTGSREVTYRPQASVNGSSHTKHIYLNLITKSQYTGAFTINGSTTQLNAGDWHSVVGSSVYKYCCKEISSLNTASSIRISNSMGDFHFGVTDYHQPSNGYDDCSIGYFSDYANSSTIAWDTTSMATVYCQGDTLNFSLDSTYITNLTYFFNGNNIGTQPFVANLNPDNTGWYVARGTDSRNCAPDFYMDSVYVLVNPAVQTELFDTICQRTDYNRYGFLLSQDSTLSPRTLELVKRYDNDNGCDSLVTLSLTIRDTVKTEFEERACYEYVWNDHRYIESGVYHQTLQDQNGCDSLVTLNLDIFSPEVKIVAENGDFCEDGVLTLTANSEITNYQWSTGETSQSIEATQTGNYSVTVTEGDCEASANYGIPQCDFTLYLPNAISPSHQDGLNDCFQLTNHDDIGQCAVYIYDRMGNLVFHSNDKYFKWDGRVKNKLYHNVMYSYSIYFTNKFGRELNAKGSLLVL